MAADETFWQRLHDLRRLGVLAVRLTWRASPGPVVGLLLLVLLQALLPTVELVLAKVVIDSAALTLGLGLPAGTLAPALPLATWILLAAGVITVGHLIQPLNLTLQSLAADRLTGWITRELIRATGTWQGIARFEDPALADDLERGRRYAARGGPSSWSTARSRCCMG